MEGERGFGWWMEVDGRLMVVSLFVSDGGLTMVSVRYLGLIYRFCGQYDPSNINFVVAP